MFKLYGTTVAYVDKVRMFDGTIWTADKDMVLAELREIAEDLESDILDSQSRSGAD